MKRLPTGVSGLDAILGGGLFSGGVYILEGAPGVGKTTLANQIAYGRAVHGKKTLYLTMLAESHARMLQHMEDQAYFRREAVNAEVFYVSGYRELERDGLRGVVRLLQTEIQRIRASFVVVDGLVVDRRTAGADESVRQFVHELQSLTVAMNCTCLILTSAGHNALSAEQTMVDGIFAFEDHSHHWRAERRMHVRKFRGSGVARGQHAYCITDQGLEFFPRLEDSGALAPAVGGQAAPAGVVASGTAALDAVLRDGGICHGSVTAVLGRSGAGKTTFSAAFAAGATLAEKGVFLSGSESQLQLRDIGGEAGLALAEAFNSGRVVYGELGRKDEGLDEMGHKLLRLVDATCARRLVIDGLPAMADTLAFPERGYRFIGRLVLELRHRGITSLVTIDPDALGAATAQQVSSEGLLSWFDNILEFSATARGHKELLIRKALRHSGAQVAIELGASAAR